MFVGRDTRASGPMLQHAVQCGLLAAGCEVVDVGVLPTPSIQMYVAASRARGGIALTASHNPPEYNALKLFNGRGLFFNNYEREELIDLYHQSEFYQAPNEEIRERAQRLRSAQRLHISPRPAARRRGRCRSGAAFRVALDGVNGAGSVMSLRFLTESLGCDLVRDESSTRRSRFRVKPSRSRKRWARLQILVREIEAAMSASRRTPMETVWPSSTRTGTFWTMMTFSRSRSRRRCDGLPGDVVVNLTTSSAIDDIAQQFGRTVYRTPVGEANVVEMIQAVKAAIGGEGSSGGIIFPAVHLCRDSYSGMALFLHRMASTGLTMSQLAARLPRYYRKIGKVAYEHGRLGHADAATRGRIPGRSDGSHRWTEVDVA